MDRWRRHDRHHDGLPTTTSCPFGGVKQSGWGRELGAEGMDSFLETSTLHWEYRHEYR